jgi:hypothetical protein
MIHFDVKHQKSESETKIKRKKAKKSEKKRTKSEKSEKIDLNFASLCFTSQQKSLYRSEAKNLK